MNHRIIRTKHILKVMNRERHIKSRQTDRHERIESLELNVVLTIFIFSFSNDKSATFLVSSSRRASTYKISKHIGVSITRTSLKNNTMKREFIPTLTWRRRMVCLADSRLAMTLRNLRCSFSACKKLNFKCSHQREIISNEVKKNLPPSNFVWIYYHVVMSNYWGP